MIDEGVMSDRDLLVKIANDSEHTKESVKKLWTKSDELSSTMSESVTTQKAHSKTLDTINEAVFTGPDALIPRVKVVEQGKSGSSGLHKLSLPPSSSANNAALLKTMGGIIMALIAIIAGVVSTGH